VVARRLRRVGVEALRHRRPLPAPVKARLLGEVAVTYVRVRMIMRRLPIGEIAALLRPSAESVHDEATCLLVGRRLASPVRRALEPGPWDSRCLVRSLVLLNMLSRRGIAATLVIGVRPGGTFEAHAWVEWEDRPLLPTLGFEPLTRI
jgi:hypothetical protein